MRFANRYGFLFIKVMRLSCKSQYAEIRFGAVLFLETIATTFCRVRPEASCASSSKPSTSTPGAFQLVFSKKGCLCRCSRHDTRVHAKSQENRRIHLDGCLIALRQNQPKDGVIWDGPRGSDLLPLWISQLRIKTVKEGVQNHPA